MCIALWVLDHPEYGLILASNRDEFLSRPTERARWHDFTDEVTGEAGVQGRILSGRDVRAGGTWLGVSRTGRVAVLTNITEPYAKYASSRGHLVSSFLLSEQALDDHVRDLLAGDETFAGFNLLLLEPAKDEDGAMSFRSAFITNHGGGGAMAARSLSPGERQCGGLSNGIDGKGANEWPKIQVGVRSMREAVRAGSADEDQLVEDLFQVLEWRTAVPPRERAEFRNTIHIEPVPAGQDQFYGTRLATVVLVRRNGSVLFVEREPWALRNGELCRPELSCQKCFRFEVTTS